MPLPLTLATRYELAGFTSGHGFRSAFLCGWWRQVLLRHHTWWGTAGVLGCNALIFLIGATRIYLHRHWLTDVLGAWLVAMVTLSASAWGQDNEGIGPSCRTQVGG